jgi:hypothetical protein
MIVSMRNRFFVFLTLLLLAACGDSSSPITGGEELPGTTAPTGSDNPTAGDPGGGIGGTGGINTVAGTGLGSITGFGSIIVNDTRTFTIGENTQILLDDQPVTETELQAEGPGLVARVDVGTDVDADFTSGTALTIDVENLLKGPVTATGPLQVLGQTVVVTGDTVLTAGTVEAALVAGDIVEVSGYANADNVVQAVRLAFRPGGTGTWKLIGVVSGLAGSTFNIGAQPVDFSGVTPLDCGAGLSDGALVKVTAAPDAAFTGGSVLSTVTGVECDQPGLEVPDQIEGTTLEAEVEGLVTSVVLPDLTVNGQAVRTTGTTTFEGGTTEDVVIGAKLEVEGVLDTQTGLLTAERIRFRETRFRLEAPLAATDIVVGQSLLALGITVLATPLTEDEDGIFSTGAGDQQVEVRGFVDGNGDVLATRVRLRGAIDLDDVRVRGPVSAVPGQPFFELFGVSVDTTGASLLDADGTPVSEAAFFALISQGVEVDVNHGAFDGTNTVADGPNGMEIRIEN